MTIYELPDGDVIDGICRLLQGERNVITTHEAGRVRRRVQKPRGFHPCLECGARTLYKRCARCDRRFRRRGC